MTERHNKRFDRQREVERVRRLLMRLHTPRFQMSLIVAITAVVGLLSSVVLLRAGVEAMWQRYPMAVGFAYVAFLILLWCWLRLRRDDWLDGVDFPGSSDRGAGRASQGEGPVDGDGVDVPDVGDVFGGADEAIFVILVLAVLFAAFWVVFWIVWSAPVLFAEILVDAALARGLYRRLPGIQEQHWLQTAIRKTALPFLWTAVLLSLAGAVIQHFVPTAKSIGDVFR